MEKKLEKAQQQAARVAALREQNEMKEMYIQMYRQTGIRFYLWYRKNFKIFIEKLNKIEDGDKHYFPLNFAPIGDVNTEDNADTEA